MNLYGYVGENPVMFRDPSGEVKNAIIKFSEITTAGIISYGTYVGYGTAGIFNDDIKYGAEFYGYSLIGTKELKYYNNSDYVKKFKETETFELLKDEINSKINNTNNISGSRGSFDEFSALTLGKFNYEANTKNIGKDKRVDVRITDVYDFNLELNDSTLLNKYLNVLHYSQDYGIIKPYNTEINLNYIIQGN